MITAPNRIQLKMPVEPIELLILCARTIVSPEQAAQMRSIAAGIEDWEAILDSASNHRILPLLCHHLSQICADRMPHKILAEMSLVFYNHAACSFGMTTELLKLVNYLAAQNIPVVPFKGPTLAALAYPDPNLRHFNDLDLLVQMQDYLKPKSLLQALGYHSEDEWFLLRSQELTYHAIMGEYLMLHETQEIEVDIHGKLAGNPFVLTADLNRFWQRLQPVSLLGQSVLTFCPEDYLLYLCLNGTKDGWSRLNVLCDICELVRSHADLNWQTLLSEAQHLGMQRLLLLGLSSAHRILGLELPEPIQRLCRTDAQVQKLTNKIQQQLYDPEAAAVEDSYSSLLLFHLTALERWQDRVYYCVQYFYNQLRLFFLVTIRDRDFLPLPRSLYFLYWFIRPVRVLQEHGLKWFKR